VTDKEWRKRAIGDFKQRKRRVGVFAVRCAATGSRWVGATQTLDAARNKLWFMLRTGSSRDVELLGEWKTHGEDAFAFEILEELDEDLPAILVNDRLRAKEREWAALEGARTLLR
jgi:hypothetical protein